MRDAGVDSEHPEPTRLTTLILDSVCMCEIDGKRKKRRRQHWFCTTPSSLLLLLFVAAAIIISENETSHFLLHSHKQKSFLTPTTRVCAINSAPKNRQS